MTGRSLSALGFLQNDKKRTQQQKFYANIFPKAKSQKFKKFYFKSNRTTFYYIQKGKLMIQNLLGTIMLYLIFFLMSEHMEIVITLKNES